MDESKCMYSNPNACTGVLRSFSCDCLFDVQCGPGLKCKFGCLFLLRSWRDKYMIASGVVYPNFVTAGKMPSKKNYYNLLAIAVLFLQTRVLWSLSPVIVTGDEFSKMTVACDNCDPRHDYVNCLLISCTIFGGVFFLCSVLIQFHSNFGVWGRRKLEFPTFAGSMSKIIYLFCFAPAILGLGYCFFPATSINGWPARYIAAVAGCMHAPAVTFLLALPHFHFCRQIVLLSLEPVIS